MDINIYSCKKELCKISFTVFTTKKYRFTKSHIKGFCFYNRIYLTSIVLDIVTTL